MSSIFDKVTDVLERAKSGAVAVFKIDGKIQTVKFPSKRYDAMMIDFARYGCFVGVYNDKATRKMITEDIEA